MIDWGQVWNTFRSGIGIGFLVAIGLIIVFIVYYVTVGSRKSQQIKVAKWRARKLIETGEIPDERTYNYIVYMLSQTSDDTEAIELLTGLEKLKSGEKIEKAT